MSETVSILVIEGEQLDRKLLTIILSMGPFIVNTIDSAEMALNQINNTAPPNLVIANENLNDCSGNTLIEKIKLSKLWKDVPILVTATDVSPTKVISLKKSGANSIISKPFNPEKLQSEVLRLTGYERVES